MAVTVTEAAGKHISSNLLSRGKGEGIRVAVRTSGCSGMAYVLEFVDEIEPEAGHPTGTLTLHRLC